MVNNLYIYIYIYIYIYRERERERERETRYCETPRTKKKKQVLLDAKTDMVKKTRYGETPLHIACRKGKAKVVETIRDWAMELDAKTKERGGVGGDMLKSLLSALDNEQRRPQDVAILSWIRNLLNNGGGEGGAYDTVVEDEAGDSKDKVQILRSTLYTVCV